jgi:ribonuclease HI
LIDFEKRSAIKSEILADFVEEWMEPNSRSKGIIPESPWLVYCDGVWGSDGGGTMTVLISPSEIKLCYTTRLQFTNEADRCTNNIAKYEAILLGFHKLRCIGVQTCVLRTDWKVVSSQIEKECIVREPTLAKYLALIRRMENHFKGFIVQYIERIRNTEVAELAKAAARNMPLPTDVFFN